MRNLLLLLLVLFCFGCSQWALDSAPVINGENCLIICNGPFTAEEYQQALLLAEEAYQRIKKLTDINITFPIALSFMEIDYDAAAYASTEGITLNTDFFFYDRNMQMEILNHEMTHVFFGSYHGQTMSVLFSEGIAEYYCGASMELKSLRKEDLRQWIDFSYHEMKTIKNDETELWSDLYSLSALFIHYWIDTFGEESLHDLYPRVSPENIIEELEKYSQLSFEEIEEQFVYYNGD